VLHLGFVDLFGLLHVLLAFGQHAAHVMNGAMAFPGVVSHPLNGALAWPG
jgi:hypothetical protein